MILFLNIFFSFMLHNIPSIYFNSCISKYNIYSNFQTYNVKNNDNNNNKELFIKEITNNKKLYSKKIFLKIQECF